MSRLLRRALPDLAIIALLLIVPLILFFPQTVGGKTLIPGDNLYQWAPYSALQNEVGAASPHNPLLSDLLLENYPWKLFAREQILSGDIPLWQNNILAGTPFLAAGQSSALYPFSVLFLLMPVWQAFGWFTVSQLWLAGISMYLLMRVLGVRHAGSLVAALVYEAGSYLVTGAVFPMIVATVAWLPLELAMIELILRQQPLFGRPASLPWAAIGAVGLGMSVLAGHVEALYFALLVMAFFAAWRLVAGIIAVWDAPDRLGRLLRRSGWLLVMVAVGLALGAVQLAPAYELARRSFRQGAAPFREVVNYAYPVRRVLAFFMPNFFGNPVHRGVFNLFAWQYTPITHNAFGQPTTSTDWGLKNYVEGAAYMGILPLALAAVALIHWAWARLPRRKGTSPPVARHLGVEAPGRTYRAFFAVLAILSGSFAFGAPTYALLYYGLPFISQSRAPFRWVWPMALAVAVLAGFGIEALVEARADALRGKRHTRPSQAAALLGRGLIVGAGAILLGIVISRIAYPAIDRFIERVFTGLARAAYAFPDAQTFYSYEALNAAVMALMILLAGVVIVLSQSRRARLWRPLAAVVIALDLGVAVWGFNPAADPALLDVVPPSIAWLKARHEELPPWRFAVYEEPGRDTLNANIGWIHGLEDISGYDSLIPAQYGDTMQVLMPQNDLLYNRIAPLTSEHEDSLDSPLLDLLNVRYVVTELTIDRLGYALVYEDEAIRIYENLDMLPRAFTLPVSSTVVYFDDAGGFFEAVQRTDVSHHVLLPFTPDPGAERPSYPGEPAEPGPAAITAYTAQEIWIDVELVEESWLVISGSYYPGWRAWVRPLGGADGEEQEIQVEKVDGNFRAVRLAPGRWTVRAKYSPDPFRFGSFASFLTALGLIFTLSVWAWRLLYRQEAERPDIQRIAKNTLTPIALNLFNKGINFVLTFAMLRILGPAGAGAYRYAIVIYGWFEILSNFGLNVYLTREVARHKDDAGRFFSNTTLLRLAFVTIGVPVLVGFLVIRQTLIDPPQTASTLWAIGLLYSGLVFSTVSTGLTALFYAFEKAEYPAAVQTISAFLTTTLGILALIAGWGIVGLAGVSVVVNAVTLVLIAVLARRLLFEQASIPFRWTFDLSLLREAVGESFPLMLNHLLATLFFRIDVVLLEALKGEVVVGWYSVVYTWVDAIMVIPSYFTLSLFPVMSRQATEDRPALRRAYVLATKLMTLIAVPTAIMTTLLAPFLVNVLGGPQYLPHGAIALQIFIWSIVIGWMNSVTQYVIIALDRQRALTVAFIIVTAFNIGANLLVIPRWSYAGAAAITILSELVLWGMFYIVVARELGRINWAGILWRVAAAGALCGGVVWALTDVNGWLAFAGGAAVYALITLALQPFTQDELSSLAPIIPAALRARLMPNVDAIPGE